MSIIGISNFLTGFRKSLEIDTGSDLANKINKEMEQKVTLLGRSRVGSEGSVEFGNIFTIDDLEIQHFYYDFNDGLGIDEYDYPSEDEKLVIEEFSKYCNEFAYICNLENTKGKAVTECNTNFFQFLNVMKEPILIAFKDKPDWGTFLEWEGFTEVSTEVFGIPGLVCYVHSNYDTTLEQKLSDFGRK